MKTEAISKLGDAQLAAFLKQNRLTLTVQEARMVAQKLGRDPTMTELHIFAIEWSEHSSYKSSKPVLKLLPTEAPNVILGPKEDAGIVFFTEHQGERYGIVISHESHNHPSQVVPFEGAATGIGGNMRDVLCMGAEIIANADALRFGDPKGQNKNRVKYVSNAVVDGIAGYSNPVGIPVICGDACFDQTFDDNCLVNVVSLGLIKEKDIIHSHAPKDAVGYDVIIVGKATDNSGFGGASFASLILDKDEEEANKGAVQVPDPFLKNMIIRATLAVFKEVRAQNIITGFKDMGAGGIMCSTSEMGADAGLGVSIDLDKVHTAFPLDPWIIACAETQERFTWFVPSSFTPTVLKIYNEDYALPENFAARASLVGKVTKEPMYVLKHKGEVVCSAPIVEVTQGILYERKAEAPENNLEEPAIPMPDLNAALLKALAHPTVCSKQMIYEHYDTSVLGRTVLPPGVADAGLLAPLPGCGAGVALSVDANPRYGKISPYWAAANAVAESMRNVVAIGATPSAMTDCLNFGNPEKAQAFWQFVDAVKGLSDAARGIGMPFTDHPLPFISGNVSFYNESANGNAVAPSPVVACVGIMQDYRNAITLGLKQEGADLYLVGERKDELGGSIFYDLHGKLGKSLPKPHFKEERQAMQFILDAIQHGMLLSCHDISDGGLACCVAEMAILGKKGATAAIEGDPVRFLFSESSGFVFEASPPQRALLEERGRKHNVKLQRIGTVTGDRLVFGSLVSQPLAAIERAWKQALPELLS
ncbi:MAG: phosphoribosylformylglycinamidine synthase subunit PurL [Nanoarchaeota archaeon]